MFLSSGASIGHAWCVDNVENDVAAPASLVMTSFVGSDEDENGDGDKDDNEDINDGSHHDHYDDNYGDSDHEDK